MDITTIFVIAFIVGFFISVAVPVIPNAIHDAIVKARRENKSQEQFPFK
jgi:hypothetical protein